MLVCIERAHSRLWNMREASLFESDPSGLTTFKILTLNLHPPSAPLFPKRSFCFLLLILLFLDCFTRKRIWHLHLRTNSNPIMRHVFPHRGRNYQESNNKGSLAKQLRIKCLFHLLIHLFIIHFLCPYFVPDTMLGTGDTEMNRLLPSWSSQPSGVTDSSARIMYCQMSYANRLCRVPWDPGRVAGLELSMGGGKKDWRERIVIRYN